MTTESERAELIGDLLKGAIPVSPTSPPTNYVTRDEFASAMSAMESKIETSGLKQKLWVLSGVIAIILAYGGGYVSLMGKLNSLTENMPTISKRLDARSDWVQAQAQRDALQDATLQRLDPHYQPATPIGAAPQ